MTKRWIGLSVAAMALAVSASAGFACEQTAKAADAKDPIEAKDVKQAKDVKTVAANADTKGCDLPCCAHANVAAADKVAANAGEEKPCAAKDAKGCPKKAGTAVAVTTKTEPANDTAKSEPAAGPGTHR